MTFLSVFWVSRRFFSLQNQRLPSEPELSIFWRLRVESHDKMTDKACFDPRKEANLLLIDIMLSWILLSHQRIVSRYQSDWEYVTFESSKSILHSAFFVNDPRFFTRIKLASDPKQNLRDLQSFSWKNSSQMIAVQSYGEIHVFLSNENDIIASFLLRFDKNRTSFCRYPPRGERKFNFLDK